MARLHKSENGSWTITRTPEEQAQSETEYVWRSRRNKALRVSHGEKPPDKSDVVTLVGANRPSDAWFATLVVTESDFQYILEPMLRETRLRMDYRQAIYEFYAEGAQAKELAKKFGISKGSLESAIHDFRPKLLKRCRECARASETYRRDCT